MSEIFTQRRFFIKRYFELTNSSLKVTVSKPFNFYEVELSFEDLTRKIFKKKSYNRFLLISSIFCLIALLMTVINAVNGNSQVDDVTFYAIPSVILLFLLWVTRQDIIYIPLYDKGNVIFFNHSPYRNNVQNFVDKILSAQKDYLLSKYAKKEPFISTERLMEQLIWLKSHYIIDETEFEELKLSLIPQNPNPVMGFKFNPSAN